jgi:hypothetical protein
VPEERVEELASRGKLGDLSGGFGAEVWPHDEATAAVALDVLLERCLPGLDDYAYEWSVRATADGACSVQLRERILGPMLYSVPTINAQVWRLAEQDEWPALAETMLAQCERGDWLLWLQGRLDNVPRRSAMSMMSRLARQSAVFGGGAVHVGMQGQEFNWTVLDDHAPETLSCDRCGEPVHRHTTRPGSLETVCP